MAIEVLYGGGQAGTVPGQIIARAGQANLDREQRGALAAQEITAQRDAQMQRIDANADLQRRAADDSMKRFALEAGLGKEMQEREYDLRIQQMQEQAKVDAQRFEYE